MNRKSRSTPARPASRVFLALVLAMIVAPHFAPAQTNEIHVLEVTPSKGTAPLGVVLTGPSTFVSQAHEFIATHGACSAAVGRGLNVFTIDWGDDARKASAWPRAPNPDCHLTHDYMAPGTYKIRAGFFQPGPADSPVPEWLGETTITVAAP